MVGASGRDRWVKRTERIMMRERERGRRWVGGAVLIRTYENEDKKVAKLTSWSKNLLNIYNKDTRILHM